MRAFLSLIITFLILNASFTLSAPVETATTTTSSPSPSASDDPSPLPSPAITGGGDEPSDGFVYLCQWTGFLQCYKYTWVAQKCNNVSKGLELIKSIVVTEGKTCSLFSNDKCIGPSSGVITGPIKEIQNPVERRSWMCWCTDPASCLSEDQSNAPEVRDVVEPVQNVELVERDSNAPAEVAMYFCKQADYGQCQLFQFVKQACVEIPDYMSTINSAILVPGTYCTLYSTDTCTGESTLPIITNVKQVGPEVVARKSFMCDCSDPEGCLLSSKKRGLEDKSVSTRSLENAELVDLDGDSAAPKGFIYLCRGPDYKSCELYPWNPDTCGKIPLDMPMVRSVVVSDLARCTFFSDDSCQSPSSGALLPIDVNRPEVAIIAKSWTCGCNGRKLCPLEKPTKRDLEKIVPANSVELLGRGDPGDPINWRYDGWFSLCADPLWGSCNDLPWRQAQCYVIDNTAGPWIKSASVSKDHQAHCFIYSKENCEGAHTPQFTFPGLGNFDELGLSGVWKSWSCKCGDGQCPFGDSSRRSIETGPEHVSDKSLKLAGRDNEASKFDGSKGAEIDSQAQKVDGELALCAGSLWGGGCSLFPWTTKECYPVANLATSWVQSASPTQENQGHFLLFRDEQCKGETSPTLVYPGLAVSERPWKSWFCRCSDDGQCPFVDSKKREIEASPEHVENIKAANVDDSLQLSGRDVQAGIFDDFKNAELLNKDAPGLDGYFAMCPASLWGGGCNLFPWTNMGCYPVPNWAVPWVQSASPTEMHQGHCWLFREERCKGENSPTLVYPGLANFEAVGVFGPWKSWACVCGERGDACPPS